MAGVVAYYQTQWVPRPSLARGRKDSQRARSLQAFYRPMRPKLANLRVSIVRFVLPVLGLGLFALLLSHVDAEELRHQLGAVGIAGFMAVLGVHALSFLCDVVLWQRSFPDQRLTRGRWLMFYRIRLVGEAWNNALPLATVGGEPLKAHLLKALYGIDYVASGTAFLIAKTANLVALVGFLAIGFACMLGDPRFAAFYQWTAGLGLAAFAIACGLLWFAQQGRLAQGIERLAPGSLHDSPRLARALNVIQRFDAALVDGYRQSPRHMATLLLLAFATWVAGIFEIQIILNAVGHPVSSTDAWIVEAAAQLVRAAAFFVPAGVGVVDGSFVLIVGIVTGSTPLGMLVAIVRRARDVVWIGLGFVAGLGFGDHHR